VPERSAEITVAAAPEDCRAVILDVEAYPRWVKGYRAVRVTERDGEGRPAVVRFTVGGFGMTASYTLAYEHSELVVAFAQTEGDLTRAIDGRYELTPRAGATSVRFTAAVEPALRAPGPLRRAVEKVIMDSALRGLRGEVERGGRPAS
jgi:ribosome-associated toxin RatA of RatAB toxin-antitoxin module